MAVAGTTNAEGKSQTDPEELMKYIEAKYRNAKEFESKIIGLEMAIGRRSSSFHVLRNGRIGITMDFIE